MTDLLELSEQPTRPGATFDRVRPRVRAVAVSSGLRDGSIAFRPITERSASVGWKVITGVPLPRMRATSRTSWKREIRRAG
jgi:hypothetical protein